MENNIEFIKVSDKVFKLFGLWASDNFEGVHSEIITVADRVVIKNSDEEMIAYINVAYEETCHIREDYFNKFINMD